MARRQGKQQEKPAPKPAPVRINRDRAAAHARRMEKKRLKGMRVPRGTARQRRRAGQGRKEGGNRPDERLIALNEAEAARNARDAISIG